MIWVSPTEPQSLREVAHRVSMFPEDFGVDALCAGQGEMVGIQRKTVADFVASVEDGRLTEQIVKMDKLDHAMVLIEGPVDFMHGELVLNGWGRAITKAGWRRMMLTVRAAGVHVEYSRDIADTIEWVMAAEGWCQSPGHSTLQVKGRRVEGKWGERTRVHYQTAMLASLPGVGEELAKRIIEQVGFPFELTTDLTCIKGMGDKKVRGVEQVVGRPRKEE